MAEVEQHTRQGEDIREMREGKIEKGLEVMVRIWINLLCEWLS